MRANGFYFDTFTQIQNMSPGHAVVFVFGLGILFWAVSSGFGTRESGESPGCLGGLLSLAGVFLAGYMILWAMHR